MIPNWSPDVWDDFTSVGLLAAIVVMFVIALVRGWLVIGRQHTDAMKTKDDTIAELRKSGETKDATIAELTRGLIERTTAEDTTTRLLTAVREAVKGGV